jgi:hypothetical protein
MFKGKLTVLTQYARTRVGQPKYMLSDSGSLCAGLTKQQMQEVANRFNLFNEVYLALDSLAQAVEREEHIAEALEEAKVTLNKY